MNELEKDTWEVTAEEEGIRLDLALSARHPEYSRTRVQRAVKEGALTLDGAVVTTPGLRLEQGQRLSFELPKLESAAESSPTAPRADATMPLDVLYEDDALLVINKPAGVVVHPGAGNQEGTLVSALLAHAPENFTDMMDEECRPGIVHRLDKDTSGCLAIAKTQAAAEALRQAFKERKTAKVYLAIARGYFEPLSGTVNEPIGRDECNRLRMDIVPVEAGGREALTKYRVVAATGGCSLLQVRIYTGRTHQIRVHMAWLRRPVLGDMLYGGGRECPPFSARRQMLHAWKLALPHPVTGEMMTFTAPMPEDFRQAAELFEKDNPKAIEALMAEDK